MNVTAEVNKDGTVDLICKQGTTWEFYVTLEDEGGNPIDLTGYTGRGQIRKDYTSENATASFTVSIDSPKDGKVKILLDAETTSSIEAGHSYKDEKSKYVYDIEIEDSNKYVTRILEGIIMVSPEVTK